MLAPSPTARPTTGLPKSSRRRDDQHQRRGDHGHDDSPRDIAERVHPVSLHEGEYVSLRRFRARGVFRRRADSMFGYQQALTGTIAQLAEFIALDRRCCPSPARALVNRYRIHVASSVRQGQRQTSPRERCFSGWCPKEVARAGVLDELNRKIERTTLVMR